MNHLADRRQEEKERRRGDIIDAAEAVAAEVGIEAMTMDEVARKARLSRALLYVYFEDKSDLWFAICQRGLENMRERFVAAEQAQMNGRAQISAMGEAFVAFSREQPVYYEALAKFAMHSPETHSHESNEGQCILGGDRVHQLMIGAIERGIGDGSIRPDVGPPGLVALTLWGYMLGAIQLVHTKESVIAHHGFTGQELIDHALRMSGIALMPR
jgi:AcrR family transcriptional regulator